MLTGRGFRRVSPWVQMALMGVLIVVLFLTPLACASIRPLVESHSPLLRWFPPFWFLGLYLDMLPGQPAGPAFHELARLARLGLAISAAAFAVTYLAGYHRHARRVMQTVEGTEGPPGRLRVAFERLVNRWLLPHPLERATFHFISNTILRNAKQRLFLATYGGIAVALALPAILHIGARPGAPIVSFHIPGLLAIPLTLSFFTVSGLRAAFNFPAELRANWIFQICESGESLPHLRAARKWIVLMGLTPLFLILTPIEIYFRGWTLAFIHLSFALSLSLLLLGVLFVWLRKIPFTCSYFPGKTSMAVMFFLYLAGFTFYSWSMADLQQRLIEQPLWLIVFYACVAAAIYGISRLERSELKVSARPHLRRRARPHRPHSRIRIGSLTVDAARDSLPLLRSPQSNRIVDKLFMLKRGAVADRDLIDDQRAAERIWKTQVDTGLNRTKPVPNHPREHCARHLKLEVHENAPSPAEPIGIQPTPTVEALAYTKPGLSACFLTS